jgi:periplasmic protein CpxP/Spy
MNNRVRALIVLIAVFLLGCLAGAGILHTWEQRVQPDRPVPMPMRSQQGRRGGLTEVLGLTQQQQTQLKQIFDDWRRQNDSVRAELEPHFEAIRIKFDAIRIENNAKITAILNEEQKKKFEQFLKEQDVSRDTPRRRGGFAGPTPPPPIPPRH